MDTLPFEIADAIAQNLDAKDCANAAVASRRMNALFSSIRDDKIREMAERARSLFYRASISIRQTEIFVRSRYDRDEDYGYDICAEDFLEIYDYFENKMRGSGFDIRFVEDFTEICEDAGVVGLDVYCTFEWFRMDLRVDISGLYHNSTSIHSRFFRREDEFYNIEIFDTMDKNIINPFYNLLYDLSKFYSMH
jgi:hypothetical protein